MRPSTAVIELAHFNVPIYAVIHITLLLILLSKLLCNNM